MSNTTEFTRQIGNILSTFEPGGARQQTFMDALKEGSSIELAHRLALVVPDTAPGVVPGKPAASGVVSMAEARAAREAELKAAAGAVNKARGYKGA